MKELQLSMRDRRKPQDIEREAAFRLSFLVTQEFDLTPQEIAASLDGSVLRVLFEDGLSPLARIIGETPEGPQCLQEVYDTLLKTNRARLHRLVARIVGQPVGRSEIRIDPRSGDVVITFTLGFLQ